MAAKYKGLIDDFFMKISDNNEATMIKMRWHAIETCDQVIRECPYRYFLTFDAMAKVFSQVENHVLGKIMFVAKDDDMTTKMTLAMLEAIKIYKKGVNSTFMDMKSGEQTFTITHKVTNKLIIKK